MEASGQSCAGVPLVGCALPADFLQFAADSGNAILDAAAVGFQLRFTVTAHADAAFLPGQVAPEPGQPREQMLQLRQFDLQLAFAGAGALGEDIENQRGAIEHLALENRFQIAALGGGSSSSKMTVSTLCCRHSAANSSALPLPMNVLATGASRRCVPLPTTSPPAVAANSLSSPRES